MKLQTKLKMNLPIPLDQKTKAEIGQRMSEVELLINAKEASKAAATKKSSEEIKDLEAELYGLAKQFQNNATNKETDCRVDFNVPEKGKKTIIRLDTNETVKVYDMSPEEIKAFEEPGLFDQPAEMSDSDYYTKLYGFDPLRIFTEEELGENCFQVTNKESLISRGIFEDDGEVELILENELRDCLAIRTSLDNITAIEINGLEHTFIAALENEDETSWYFYKPIIPEAVNVEPAEDAPDSENNSEDMNEEPESDEVETDESYKLPENVEDGTNQG